MILVDTCILLDVAQADPRWADWSQEQLAHGLERGGLLINPVVYSEFSVWYDRIEQVDRDLAQFGVNYEELPREALFVVGKAFRQYRLHGGTHTSVLPDFFIGAHAAVRGIPLLTRGTARVRTCFRPLRRGVRRDKRWQVLRFSNLYENGLLRFDPLLTVAQADEESIVVNVMGDRTARHGSAPQDSGDRAAVCARQFPGRH